MGYYDSWNEYYPKSTPRKVEGGIKAKSKKGAIGSTWWSQRWVSVLDSFGWTNRLERGRRYARAGQVLKIKIIPGRAGAQVQGSRSSPYTVTINLIPFSPEEWEKIISKMSEKAIFSAKLLDGEMPENIEEAFAEAGKPLFPTSSKDLTTNCTCPDDANPCKHIAAAHYILAEEFDKDPFMIFRLRGMEKEELLEVLRKKRATESDNIVRDIPADALDKEKEKMGDELTLTNFWSGRSSSHISFSIAPPEVNAAIIKRLGTPSFWDSKEDFVGLMGKLYAEVSKKAAEAAYSEKENLQPKDKRT